MRRLIFGHHATVQSIADRTRDPIAGEDMKMPPQERDRRCRRLRLKSGTPEPAHASCGQVCENGA